MSFFRLLSRYFTTLPTLLSGFGLFVAFHESRHVQLSSLHLFLTVPRQSVDSIGIRSVRRHFPNVNWKESDVCFGFGHW